MYLVVLVYKELSLPLFSFFSFSKLCCMQTIDAGVGERREDGTGCLLEVLLFHFWHVVVWCILLCLQVCRKYTM